MIVRIHIPKYNFPQMAQIFADKYQLFSACFSEFCGKYTIDDADNHFHLKGVNRH
jgi:hypothetical protein